MGGPSSCSPFAADRPSLRCATVDATRGREAGSLPEPVDRRTMGSTADLEFKWTSIREANDTVEAYDLAQATAHGFFLVFNDRGGNGPGAIDITAVGAFEDPGDCLGYLRYYELSEMLDWRATFEQERAAGGDDEALGPLEAGLAADVMELARALEAAIDQEPAAEDLALLRDRWNEAFALTNPGSTIEAWGTLAEVLSSSYVVDVLLDEDHDGEFEPFVASVLAGEFDADRPSALPEALAALAVVERF